MRHDSEGPAFFRQERVGKGGQAFTLLKFRSMAAAPVPAGLRVTAATDPRITKVGAKLRATKVDELPQLINVLRGDMSIVGPRPEVAEYVSLWSAEDRRIVLSVRPGITDPATLLLRHEERLLADQPNPETYYRETLIPQKVRLYRHYVESRSFATDLGLIIRTIASTIGR